MLEGLEEFGKRSQVNSVNSDELYKSELRQKQETDFFRFKVLSSLFTRQVTSKRSWISHGQCLIRKLFMYNLIKE